nr:hypothetical protein GZ17F1_5 [uncultured archaeon GZfos17F1]
MVYRAAATAHNRSQFSPRWLLLLGRHLAHLPSGIDKSKKRPVNICHGSCEESLVSAPFTSVV